MSDDDYMPYMIAPVGEKDLPEGVIMAQELVGPDGTKEIHYAYTPQEAIQLIIASGIDIHAFMRDAGELRDEYLQEESEGEEE